jgi:hypothetical protein
MSSISGAVGRVGAFLCKTAPRSVLRSVGPLQLTRGMAAPKRKVTPSRSGMRSANKGGCRFSNMLYLHFQAAVAGR